jgi:hypothetical protein
MLTGGVDPVEAVDVPPEGFVRLAPAPRSAEVPVMFGRLGIWAALTRRGLVVGQRCSCERPPVWIRVIPSVPWDRRPPSWGRGDNSCREDT